MTRLTARCIASLLALAFPAQAELLPTGQVWREIPFQVVDEKPMLDASVGDSTGRMMFDTGTPELVFLNRDALALGKGQTVARGFAASGQPIEVQLHDAPEVAVGGVPLDIGAKAVSGDFGFVEGLFGADYLGFIGLPAVEGGAFVLDYGRHVLTVMHSDASRLAVPPPEADEVVATLTIALLSGEQPTTGAFVGSLPVLLDFDTGDSGTFYLRPETRARLEAAGSLTMTGDAASLSGVTFGGARFDGLAVRLGAGFLAEHPSLWDFPAGTITFLRPDAAFLAPR
jgi:hypothetical protein